MKEFLSHQLNRSFIDKWKKYNKDKTKPEIKVHLIL